MKYLAVSFSKIVVLLLQHLGFVHCPIREHCPAYPQCTDCLVERAVQRRVAGGRPPSGHEPDHLNIILLGKMDNFTL